MVAKKAQSTVTTLLIQHNQTLKAVKENKQLCFQILKKVYSN